MRRDQTPAKVLAFLKTAVYGDLVSGTAVPPLKKRARSSAGSEH